MRKLLLGTTALAAAASLTANAALAERVAAAAKAVVPKSNFLIIISLKIV